MMLAVESKPASKEEGIMMTLEKCMNESQPIVIEGQQWYHKNSIIQAHPKSKSAAYAQLEHVNDFLQTKRISGSTYLRVDETIDWRMEMMAGAISVNDMSALNRLEMTAMHNQIASYVSLHGDVFAEYDGIVKDIQKQLKEQARINSRLQRAFKRIGV